MYHHAARLLLSDQAPPDELHDLLRAIGFADPERAQQRVAGLCGDASCDRALAESLPMLLAALSETAIPDGSLINFERYVQSVPDRAQLFQYLAERPRAVEILVKLFVGSQFLTEILLKNPDYLERLTLHRRLAEFKYREQFFFEACAAAAGAGDLAQRWDAIRRYQKWELLRIGACDSFGLLDLRNVTLQLSLLADGIVQACLAMLREELQVDVSGFCVLAFGKLGGEELNYSSDIDLVFLSGDNATQYWELGQKLIKGLITATSEGFLYRVDMRLRPWGKSGALVNTLDAHVAYLQKHGRAWEKQALLKARPIAGNIEMGHAFLRRIEPLIFGMDNAEIYDNVRETKRKIEQELGRKGRTWGEVKGGPGSIRDIEFLTQYMQLIHGRAQKAVRGVGTLDSLVRLADLGFLPADEYRGLTDGYNFLRTIEHALQLMHHKQVHSLPSEPRELAYLARRLDFPSGDEFLVRYERTVRTIRRIFNRHLGDNVEADPAETGLGIKGLPEHLARMEPSYQQTFQPEQIERHAEMLRLLSTENAVEIEVTRLAPGGAAPPGERWELTIAGRDHLGDLSMICGLLFVHGFDIVSGQVFTEITGRQQSSQTRGSEFVNVFQIHPTRPIQPGIWVEYEQELEDLIRLVAEGNAREAHGKLAKRVAASLHQRPARASAPTPETTLLPVDVQIDNTMSELSTVLHIRAEDTIGFLYELTNALALMDIDINRMIITSAGKQVFDTLYITTADGRKILDERALRELRTQIVLIKHFTHLLPKSPNPESALLHFGDFLTELFRQENWVEQVASLERGEVLSGLARLLGVSDFLWEDFLRLQYTNLFPVLTDFAALGAPKSRGRLDEELAERLSGGHDLAWWREQLNAFKDREMFRIDMRHILEFTADFYLFSEELTELAEVVVAGAAGIVERELAPRFGLPRRADGTPVPLSICALGKCGGHELGYASDIELMFIHDGEGQSDGPESIRASEYFQRFVELFMNLIVARQEGIFQLDLRLRPYGRAGSLAVAKEAFEAYFRPAGPAWPYERQALVKLRPIAGDAQLGDEIRQLRDKLLYTGEPFDIVAMRAMREKQVRQLVKAGTFNAKLSPGGLVDTEYLVQGLQITHGNTNPALRTTNTFEAIAALDSAGLLQGHSQRLREAYRFQRQLIDALRMVRGNARDLTVPQTNQEEFEFLARRLGYETEPARLAADIERHTQAILELQRQLPIG